ncbi:MAG: class B sortase [Acutalibacteraceae bacterium]|nr:class B sortase [Acutalibacteraceae bacterium]
MNENKKSVWKIIFVIAIILIIAGLGFICVYLFNLYTSGTEYDKIQPTEIVTEQSTEQTTRSISNAATGDTPDAPQDNIAPSEVHDTVNGGINFTELWKINTDLYAWIKIPNTRINYPIAQYPGDDDAYYLTHNMYKESAFAGCIYTEKLNNKDFSDPNTILYGHNMLNGSMFRELHNFRDETFFNENQYIYIYLPDRTLTYQIFSAYEYDDRHILYSFDFTDKKVFQEYLDYAQNPTSSMMYNKRDLNITTDDKIITLSTCLGNIETSRYLVQGVLIKDEPTT